MILRRIEPLSAAKLMGTLYTLLGLFIGAIMSLIAILGVAAQGGQGAEGVLLGVGAVIVLPIMYGIGGFIGGGIMAALYNLVASLVGGIKIDFVSMERYEQA